MEQIDEVTKDSGNNGIKGSVICFVWQHTKREKCANCLSLFISSHYK